MSIIKIPMIDLSSIGLVLAPCFADFSHHAVCVDKEDSKIEWLNASILQIVQQGLVSLDVLEEQADVCIASGKLTGANFGAAPQIAQALQICSNNML